MAVTLPVRVDLDSRHRRQSEDEKDLLKALDQLHDEGKEVRDRWAPPKEIERDLKLYRGEAGPTGRDPYFEANFIETFINRMVDQLTDNRPGLRVEARKAGLRNVATVSTKVISATWDDTVMQRQAYKMCHSAATMRSAGLYTGYDPITDEIILETLQLPQVVFDPAITEAGLIKKSEYLAIERIRPLDEVKYRFPARGAEVKPDAYLLDSPEQAKKLTMTGPLTDLIRGRQGDAKGLPRCKVWEWHLIDRQKGPDGPPMFPGGRMILRSKDLILWDGPNPYWDAIHPVDWFDWVVDPQSAWGRSEPSRLMRVQMAFNQIMDGLVENQILSNFLSVVGDYDSMDENTWKRLHAISSSIILRKKNRNAMAPMIVPPPTFGADKIALARFIFTIGQLMTGVTDVTLGETPGSLQSGEAIEGLQEGANLGTRSRASRLEDFFARVGQKLLARIMQFYTADRVVHMVGPTGEAIEFALKRQEFFMSDEGTSLIDAISVKEQEHQRREVFRSLVFKVQPGSSAPGTRVRRARLMIDLVKLAAASREDLLIAADFPNPKEMLERAKKEYIEMGPIPGTNSKTQGG